MRRLLAELCYAAIKIVITMHIMSLLRKIVSYMEAVFLTVKSDIEKAKAQALAAQGSYATFSSATDDPVAKQMFQQMERDMGRHVDQLNSRLNYVNANNDLNKQADEQQQKQQMKLKNPRME